MRGTRAEQSLSLWVTIQTAGISLEGDLRLPAGAHGVVVFPHGSGIRRGPRDGVVAQQLREMGLGTLVLTLLTAEEQNLDARSACFRFDTNLLAGRLKAITEWLAEEPTTQGLPIGYFGGSSGAAAVLTAVAERPDAVGAVVLQNGRPNLPAAALVRVLTPTLILVGGDEEPDINLNEPIVEQLGTTDKQFVVVPVAALGPNQPGGLEEVARLAAEWFTAHPNRSAGSPHANNKKTPTHQTVPASSR